MAISFHGARVTWHCFTSNGEKMPNVGNHIPLTNFKCTSVQKHIHREKEIVLQNPVMSNHLHLRHDHQWRFSSLAC